MKRMLLPAIALLPTLLHAEEVFKPRERDPSPHGQYVTVDLSPVANDLRPVKFPAARVEVNRIPFKVSVGGETNCLFLKPIGWAGGKNEATEYPGYMANYDKPPKPGDTTRAVVRVPVADYSVVYLLAAADDDESLTQDLTLRFGILAGQARATYHDFTAVIPRSGDKKARPRTSGVVRVIPTGAGNLYLIRVPIGKVLAQDFRDHWALDLDITKKLGVAVNLPDPYRYQLRPVGDPSGVRIFAMTLHRSSLQMEVISRELGNVFNEPQQPTFDVILRNHYEHYREYHLEAAVRRDDGKEDRFSFPSFRNWTPIHRNPLLKRTIELPVSERGHYELKVELMLGKKRFLYRKTTFAILAHDTRKYRHESPFGTWDFRGTHLTPADDDLVGQLAVKAGWRYARKSEKYGLKSFSFPGLHRPAVFPHYEKKLKENPDYRMERFMIFHENGISGAHMTRTPDTFTGKTYEMNDAEKETFNKLWDTADKAFTFVEKNLPDSQVYFGNGTPHLIEEFCRRGLSKDRLKIAGNECGSFMRPPETQPTDFVANNAGIWMFRRVLDHYGYTDTKVYQCFEVGYPNTNPGNLKYETQAAYFIRHFMHSLAWGIPVMTFGCVTDMGNSYYHSNWGSSGFCFAYPNVSPKKSYVACAVMTQALDGAEFVRTVPTGSPVVYALEFKRKDRKVVTCLWTPRGRRQLILESKTRKGTRTEMLGRESRLEFKAGMATTEIGPYPVYLTTTKPIRSIVAGKTTHDPMPDGEPFTVSRLDRLADWTVESGSSVELETYNFMCPRRKGDFVYRETAQKAGREKVIEVEPQPVEGIEYLPRYSVLRKNQPIEIPGKPTEIGLWVHGNGGWGRVIFELEDATGQRWISIGAEMGGEPNPWMADWMSKEEFDKLRKSGGAGVSDWNSNDAWGRGVINHEGWRYVKFPLPGQYGEATNDYHWPCNSQWRFSGDGVVTYPLKFTKLILSVPEKVLYLTRYEAVKERRFYLQGLAATYVPPEEAFAGE